MSRPIRVALLGCEDDLERGLAVAKSLNAKIIAVVGNGPHTLESTRRLAAHLEVPAVASHRELTRRRRVDVIVSLLPWAEAMELIADVIGSRVQVVWENRSAPPTDPDPIRFR